MLLQDRARSLGVHMHFSHEATTETLDADLIVAADGINSATRDRHAQHFRPTTDLRPNRFTWMGSTKPLDAFTFSFRETPHGIFIAHAYQYEPGRSTWVLETDPQTFANAGLADMDEQRSARFMEHVFAEDLDGHPLITNRSLWRSFPMIRTASYVHGNTVLLGDAKATAHFSIGSGTKLAMEDAIHLFEAFRAHPTVPEALKAFDTARRDEVERTQHAADVSLVWFEHLQRFAHMDPQQFAFGLMTRSRSITYDNLALRAPGFIESTNRMFAAQTRAAGFPEARPIPPMFQPLRLRGLTLANRVVVSPMCMYSAIDGVPNDWHRVHYGARALGGAGLVFTEMTCISPEARISPGCAGLWTDEQEQAWRQIVGFAHQHTSAKMCLQLGHAGRKGATRLMWDGMDRPLPAGAWDIVAPSPIPYYPESQTPQPLDRPGMDAIRDQFAAAAARAHRAGFDMIELHAAHGYLLATFLSPLTNQRTDDYGGPLENRLRFPLEVFRAVRAAWPGEKPISVRISAHDWAEGGISTADAVAIAQAFADAGADLIDVSSGQTVADARAVYGRMYQVPFSDQIRNEAGLATMCVGNITTADQVNTILAAGRADLVALGRPHLANPNFTLQAAARYGIDLPRVAPQYAPGVQQAYRLEQQAAAELSDLRRKAAPKPPIAVPQAVPRAAE